MLRQRQLKRVDSEKFRNSDLRKYNPFVMYLLTCVSGTISGRTLTKLLVAEKRGGEKMTQLEFLKDWAAIAINVIVWGGLAYPAILRLFWPWHQHWWGRNFVATEVCTALALLGAVVYHDWRPLAHLLFGFYWLQNLSFTAIPIILIWRGVIMFRIQRALAENSIPDAKDEEEDTHI